MRSRAAVMYDYNQPLVIEEIEVDGPKSREVLVRMQAAGVCHSDLHTMQGTFLTNLPLVLGHEGAGIVEAVGPDVDHVRPGDHVVLSWLPSCGVCRSCMRHRPAICLDAAWPSSGMLRDGTSRFHCDDAGRTMHHYGASSTFTEYTVVPAQSAIKVDPDVPLAPLSLIGCAVTTGVGAVLNTAKIVPQDRVAIVGCGGVGLNAIQGARIAGAEMIVAIDNSPEKLRLARELGATHTVDARADHAIDQIRDLTEGGVDYAFEAVGIAATIDFAVSILGKGGEAVLIGMSKPDLKTQVSALGLVTQEQVVRGSWYGSSQPAIDFPKMVDLYRSGALKLDMMLDLQPLEKVNEAFADLSAGKPGRTVLTF